MTDTEPSTRPIHETVEVDRLHSDGPALLIINGKPRSYVTADEGGMVEALVAAAGKVHAVLVDLPDVAGGGQLATWSYPNGAVEASWRQSARDTWVPVELLDGGSVVVAP